MVYTFNIKKGQEKTTEAFLEQLKLSQPNINYKSKSTYIEEYNSLKHMVQLLGIGLCAILSFIALINLINILITNILVRRKEIAALRSIGMSRFQLTKLLLYEALYYSGISYIIAMVFSLVAGFTLIKSVCNDMDFLTYSFSGSTCIYLLIVMLIISMIIVKMIECFLNRNSIVEQLRNV